MARKKVWLVGTASQIFRNLGESQILRFVLLRRVIESIGYSIRATGECETGGGCRDHVPLQRQPIRKTILIHGNSGNNRRGSEGTDMMHRSHSPRVLQFYDRPVTFRTNPTG